ncbi:MAG: radical SAM family heme chaperone HemW [Aureispira sp.]
MSGLYIHIPFCKQACNYCNFHFSTSLGQKEALLAALHLELQQRAPQWRQPLQTVYLGGGTPSILSAQEINALWATIEQYYLLAPEMEITLEANPDDLTVEYVQELRDTPINRFSIGIQSFFEEDLQWMNRAHNAQQARACLEIAQAAGFDQLTIDLIYGGPTTTHEHWAANLATVFELQVPHFSCYALTVEPNTALAHQIKTGKRAAVEDAHAAEQFDYLLAQIAAKGYEQYEISNFCRPPNYAQHNSNYWTGAPYLGVGPAAHSFDGENRRWNVAHNPKYINGITTGETYWESELLTVQDRHNEYIMTALRTKWGVDLERLKQWGTRVVPQFEAQAARYLERGWIQKKGQTYVLTNQGKFLADAIISDFFWTD